MKKLDKGIQIIIAAVLATAILLYCFFLFLLPKIINSPKNIAKIEKLLLNKTGFAVKIDGFRYESNPNLTFDLKAKQISAASGEKENLIDIDNLDYHAFILNKKHGKLSADYIFADINLIKKYFKTEKKDKKKLDLSDFPITNIKKGKIILNENTYANIDSIDSEKKHGKILTKISAEVFNPYTKHPVKVGESGLIIFGSNLGFEDFSIKAGSSKIFITGGSKNLKIKGKSLPVKELEEGNVDLDDAINKYTEAMKIAKECSTELDNATKAVNKILNENSELEDFKELDNNEMGE